MPNVPSQEEHDALASRVAALEALHQDTPVDPPVDPPIDPPVVGKGQLFSHMLEMVGGWRLPKKGVDGVGSHGLSFVGGGVHIEGDGAEKTILTIGHNTKNKLHELSFSMDDIGTDPDHTQWPEMIPTGIWDSTIDDVTDLGGARCVGAWKHPDGSMLTSNHCGYATSQARLNLRFLTWLSEAEGPVNAMDTPEGLARQSSGGAFVEIPRWFADQYCDGKSLGLFGGGKHSGQGWSLGPTLAAIAKPEAYASDPGSATVLMKYGRYENDSTEFVERRYPDYGPDAEGKNLFGFPLPQDGVGFWQADDVPAATWVDTEDVTGLLVWSIQGTGSLDYALQTVGMSETLKTRIYFYDADQLAMVAEGHLEPHEVQGRFYEWENPFELSGRSTDDRWPVGAYWDGEYLFVLYRKSSGQKLGPSPVLVAYRINTEA